MNGLRKDDKGFTLVELIVVLVILAILAAILVPALLGYIDRARDADLIVNGKNLLNGIQAEVSTVYATADVNGFNEWIFDPKTDPNALAKDLADAKKGGMVVFCMKAPPAPPNSEHHPAWTVYKLIYYDRDSDSAVYYNGSSWENLNIGPENSIETAKNRIKESEKYPDGSKIEHWYEVGNY